MKGLNDMFSEEVLKHLVRELVIKGSSYEMAETGTRVKPKSLMVGEKQFLGVVSNPILYNDQSMTNTATITLTDPEDDQSFQLKVEYSFDANDDIGYIKLV